MQRRFHPSARIIAGLHGPLPSRTLFHDAPVPPLSKLRAQWLKEAASVVRASAILFCDPDNGIKFDGVCHSRRHISLDEIIALYRHGHSLIVYHTPNRSAPHGPQVAVAMDRLRDAVPDLGALWAARFRRGSSRVFFVLAQPEHSAAIDKGMVQMLSTAWTHDGHFEIVCGARRTGQQIRAEQVDQRVVQSQINSANDDVSRLANSHRGHRAVDVRRGTLPDLASTGVGNVHVVLNDNGGLNMTANPWLAEIDIPCGLIWERQTFRVEAAFSGRGDMFRISPSALKLGRSVSPSLDHLSKRTPISFKARIVGR